MNKEEYEIINVPTIGRVILNNKTKKIYHSEFEIIEEKNKEIDKLNNVINELEKWLNNQTMISLKYEIGYYKEVLDKLKELKENKQ